MKPGKLIRINREKMEMTQLELSRLMGYRIPQFVSLMENGHSKIPVKLIPLLTKYLEIDPEVLIGALVKEYRAEVKAEIAKHRK